MSFNVPNDMINSMHYDVINITLVTVELENDIKATLPLNCMCWPITVCLVNVSIVVMEE